MSHGTGFSQPLGASGSAEMRDLGGRLGVWNLQWMGAAWLGEISRVLTLPCRAWAGTGLLANGGTHSETVDVYRLPLRAKRGLSLGQLLRDLAGTSQNRTTSEPVGTQLDTHSAAAAASHADAWPYTSCQTCTHTHTGY